MEVFIKSSFDLSTKWNGPAISWSDLPIESVGNETGQVIIPDTGVDYSGDFLVLIGGQPFLIERTSPSNGSRTLTISAVFNFFSRDLIWPGQNENTKYSTFIATELNRKYKNCDDPAFAINYLRVAVGSSDVIMPYREYEDPGIYNLIDIFEEAIASGVIIKSKIIMAGDGGWSLRVTFSDPESSAHNVFFNDGHATILSETYTKDLVSKITIFHPNSIEVPDPEDSSKTITVTEYDTSVWYLSSSGEVSTNIPEDRAEGNWIMLTINEDENPEEMAIRAFSENVNSHKIEFYSDREYSIWDVVLLRINSEVFSSFITSKTISSSQNRYLYKCGELSTTLTERVSKLEKDKR